MRDAWGAAPARAARDSLETRVRPRRRVVWDGSTRVGEQKGGSMCSDSTRAYGRLLMIASRYGYLPRPFVGWGVCSRQCSGVVREASGSWGFPFQGSFGRPPRRPAARAGTLQYMTQECSSRLGSISGPRIGAARPGKRTPPVASVQGKPVGLFRVNLFQGGALPRVSRRGAPS